MAVLFVLLASADRLALVDFMLPHSLHSAKTALKGVLSLIHECVDPLYFNFPPPLLLNLNSLASPSTKGKNSGLRSWLYCASWRPAQCSCAFHLHAHFGFYTRDLKMLMWWTSYHTVLLCDICRVVGFPVESSLTSRLFLAWWITLFCMSE